MDLTKGDNKNLQYSKFKTGFLGKSLDFKNLKSSNKIINNKKAIILPIIVLIATITFTILNFINSKPTKNTLGESIDVNKRTELIENNIKSSKILLYPENKDKLFKIDWLETLENANGRIALELGSGFESNMINPNWENSAYPENIKSYFTDIENKLLLNLEKGLDTKTFLELINYSNINIKLNTINENIKNSKKQFYLESIGNYQIIIDKNLNVIGIQFTKLMNQINELFNKSTEANYTLNDYTFNHQMDYFFESRVAILKDISGNPNGRFFMFKPLKSSEINKTELDKLSLEIIRSNLGNSESLYGYIKKLKNPNGEEVTVKAANRNLFNNIILEQHLK